MDGWWVVGGCLVGCYGGRVGTSICHVWVQSADFLELVAEAANVFYVDVRSGGQAGGNVQAAGGWTEGSWR